MRKTIEDMEVIVNRRFKVMVSYDEETPRYVFTDKQTGATTSCDYNKNDFNQTVAELLYA